MRPSLLEDMQVAIQDALDDLSSPRSSLDTKAEALQVIERLFAAACLNKDTEDLDAFLALQFTFECNVPLRLLAYICASTPLLDSLISKGSVNGDREAQASALSVQLSLALSLIQGVALNHSASKKYLGRKYVQEILLDLFITSRHLSAPSAPTTATTAGNAGGDGGGGGRSSTPIRAPVHAPLLSTVLDTLLCILVDSPTAIRTFEEANGVQAVVRILKRAGTPREVRMKCLEFLYFYLLDETPSPDNKLLAKAEIEPTRTAPATPVHGFHRRTSSKPYFSVTPNLPTSRLGSSFTSTVASSPAPSSRSASSSSVTSTNSFCSTSSNASSSTGFSSLSSSPEKPSSMHQQVQPQRPQQLLKTPPNSPPLTHRAPPQQLQPRPLMMLRKEVDYVPLSPKKPHVAHPRAKILGTPSHSSIGASPASSPFPVRTTAPRFGSKPIPPRSRLGSSEDDCRIWDDVYAEVESASSSASSALNSSSGSSSAGTSSSFGSDVSSSAGLADAMEQRQVRELVLRTARNLKMERTKTTEEKKELLGTLLGNVDALVEGVRKAGIWGLG